MTVVNLPLPSQKKEIGVGRSSGEERMNLHVTSPHFPFISPAAFEVVGVLIGSALLTPL